MSRLLTIEEVAARLAVTVDTVRRWHKAGMLPGRRIGPRVLRWSEEDLEKAATSGNSTSVGACK